jgi:predicted nucleic acid-binding protein
MSAVPQPATTDLVIDAGVAVKWFLPEIHSDRAQRLLDVRFRRHVPTQLYPEVANVVWKRVHLSREITADEGREILRNLVVMPLEIHPTAPLLESAFVIAVTTGRTVYDSLYVALAAALSCRLVTADQTLCNALQSSPFAAHVLWVVDPL